MKEELIKQLTAYKKQCDRGAKELSTTMSLEGFLAFLETGQDPALVDDGKSNDQEGEE